MCETGRQLARNVYGPGENFCSISPKDQFVAGKNPFAKGGKCPDCGKPMAQCNCASMSKGKGGKAPSPPKGKKKK